MTDNACEPTACPPPPPPHLHSRMPVRQPEVPPLGAQRLSSNRGGGVCWATGGGSDVYEAKALTSEPLRPVC